MILDEAVSALDRSVEAQVLNMLVDLKSEFGLTYLFISHDLNVVQYLNDRVLVMYLGKIVELGPGRGHLRQSICIPTRALLSARPSMDPRKRTRERRSRAIPQPDRSAVGLPLPTRCPFAEDVCAAREPAAGRRRGSPSPATCASRVPGHSRQAA